MAKAKMGNAVKQKILCLEQEIASHLDYTSDVCFNNNKSGNRACSDGEYSAALVLLLEALLLSEFTRKKKIYPTYMQSLGFLYILLK